MIAEKHLPEFIQSHMKINSLDLHRMLERSKHMFPQKNGLMVIYQGRIRKKSPTKQIQEERTLCFTFLCFSPIGRSTVTNSVPDGVNNHWSSRIFPHVVVPFPTILRYNWPKTQAPPPQKNSNDSNWSIFTLLQMPAFTRNTWDIRHFRRVSRTAHEISRTSETDETRPQVSRYPSQKIPRYHGGILKAQQIAAFEPQKNRFWTKQVIFFSGRVSG